MAIQNYILQEDPDDFFKSNRKATMLFSRRAAKQIFEIASSKGIAIMRYEGGILVNGIFQAKLDAVWDRLYSHSGSKFLEEGNLRAIAAIETEPENYNAFAVTAMPVE
ncbi:hypothetical protein [Microvirga sp. 2TAF3]|uniref:hypothetical protein n=1 Tax=Microvirga sp. 2TAF3 TaxID=3233014 RepID=UPI003F9B3448